VLVSRRRSVAVKLAQARPSRPKRLAAERTPQQSKLPLDCSLMPYAVYFELKLETGGSRWRADHVVIAGPAVLGKISRPERRSRVGARASGASPEEAARA